MDPNTLRTRVEEAIREHIQDDGRQSGGNSPFVLAALVSKCLISNIGA
jgi:hypothetical protein